MYRVTFKFCKIFMGERSLFCHLRMALRVLTTSNGLLLSSKPDFLTGQKTFSCKVRDNHGHLFMQTRLMDSPPAHDFCYTVLSGKSKARTSSPTVCHASSWQQGKARSSGTVPKNGPISRGTPTVVLFREVKPVQSEGFQKCVKCTHPGCVIDKV